MAAVKYTVGEHEDVGGYVDVFDVVVSYLLPGSQLSQQEALTRIESLLPVISSPNRSERAQDSGLFYMIALDIAGQSPLRHDNITKLAAMITTMIKTFDAAQCAASKSSHVYVEEWFDTVVGDHASRPGEAGYAGEQDLISKVFAVVHTTTPIDLTAILPFRLAFEAEGEDTEANVKSAAVWILNYGAFIYKAVLQPDEVDDPGIFAGAKYEELADPSNKISTVKRAKMAIANVLSRSSGDKKVRKLLTPHRWSYWGQCLSNVAASSKEGGKYGTECRRAAGEAADVMRDLEVRAQQTPDSGRTSLSEKQVEA